jgi:hypothetical protein
MQKVIDFIVGALQALAVAAFVAGVIFVTARKWRGV